ncbi:sensor histidine kinase [Paenibacillus sp. CMAA1739]|uniref:cache domain-containing sensor histidine kinase n=1 Tax=Paenibacillus ottowii TaxID=2315729 RepID=UPI00272F769F|nr:MULTISPECIES: sensor histidine kinase [Paenibacillus]MDP1509870.1 sensor histidine kinase [Paenibacillus ottowii]MEC4567254.1 sensor histidine kinase [Paenibacillus sp. CMAA1739]
MMPRLRLRNMPLRYQLMLLFLLFGIVPSLGLGLLVNWTVERIVERQVENHTMQLIGKVNEALDTKMENLQNMTYLIAFNPEIGEFWKGWTLADGHAGHTSGATTENQGKQAQQPLLNQAPGSKQAVSSVQEQDTLYEMKQFLQGFTTLYPEIAGILIVNEKGDYISNEMYARSTRSLTEEDWYTQAAQHVGIFTVLGQPSHRNVTTHVRYKDSEIVSVVRSVTDSETGHVLGVIMIDLKLRAVSQAARDVTLGKSGYVMVTDAEGRSVYMPDMPLIERIPPQWFGTGDSGMFTREAGGRELLFMFQASEFTGWRTVGVFPARESTLEVRQIQFYVVCFVFIVCLFGLTASLRLSSSIAQPIFRLMSYMRKAETGDLTVRQWSERGDEIGMLGRSFNRMLEQIRRLMSLSELRERQKRDAELRSLQEHIKPHFLYNTLDTIHWMARKNGADDVSDMVGALSKLFRLGLSKGDDFIPLHSEIEHISSYMQIQQTRYRDRLRWELNVPDELKDLFVLKLMLQPVVENAIYHGIKARRGPGTICVEAKAEDDKLLLTVRDDGAGMTAERLRELREWLERPLEAMEGRQKQKGVRANGRSYGMLNVQARIRLSFGEEYGIALDSKEGAGTCVTITHPLLLDMAQLKKPYDRGEGQDDEIQGNRQRDNGESD